MVVWLSHEHSITCADESVSSARLSTDEGVNVSFVRCIISIIILSVNLLEIGRFEVFLVCLEMSSKSKKEAKGEAEQQPQPPHMTAMKPVTEGAYGGGMYGTEKNNKEENTSNRAPASDTQSADGPVGHTIEPKHKPPPSSGDRDIDITGQSYIQ
ncbi:uncharacterized protein LOC113346786 [Papaver somniferum]|uniref:uncharacterized protein LOC113346786 n=1 Tax=Papaver somniferum TaxID=3469 RepID=UPI000E704FCC|nr:uncharacterized protein LOC113346786 [Papaver somniferum]